MLLWIKVLLMYSSIYLPAVLSMWLQTVKFIAKPVVGGATLQSIVLDEGQPKRGGQDE